MNRIRELRMRLGMQQKELALAVDVARPTISEWEHQKKDPSGNRLTRLSDFFNVSKGVILCLEDIPDPTPVIYVDNGTDNVEREVREARARVQRDPERKILFKMATDSDIMNVRRAIAILNVLENIQ